MRLLRFRWHRILREIRVFKDDVSEEALDRCRECLDLLIVEHAARDILMRKRQRRPRHLIVIVRERVLRHEGLRVLNDLERVVGQHAMIKHFRVRKRGLIAEQNLEEVERLDMASEHNENHGQGRRENEAHGSP